MFIRVVVAVPNPQSRRLTGIFDVAYDLRDSGEFPAADWVGLYLLLAWFEDHLPVPTRFARSRRRNAYHDAICWFKADAGPCVSRVRELAALLGRHGQPTRMLRTDRPGYVVYEDPYQVVAVPFRDTRS